MEARMSVIAKDILTTESDKNAVEALMTPNLEKKDVKLTYKKESYTLTTRYPQEFLYK